MGTKIESKTLKQVRLVMASALASSALMGLAGCESLEVVNVGGSQILVVKKNNQEAVCNPLGSASPASLADNGVGAGIVASLKYIDGAKGHYPTVAGYKLDGSEVDARLFLDNIDVPTRKFDLGFYTKSGKLVTNASGHKLYTHFSLHFESQIQLANNDQGGDYQFALLSDDGAVLEADAGGGFEILVDNDGNHQSRFVAAQSVVHLQSGDKLPIRLDYYQGPANHIALILMWRKVPPTGLADPANGLTGNSTFFDFNKALSLPKKPYLDLLSRGWSPVPARNFVLPQGVVNPCHQPAPSPSETPPAPTPTPTPTVTASPSPSPSPSESPSPSPSPSESPSPSPSPSESPSPSPTVTASPTPTPTETSPPSVPITTRIDSVDPNASPTNQIWVTFTFSSNYANAEFFCSLDGALPLSCASPSAYSGLSDGAHSFTVYASVNGVSDTVGASYAWEIDTVAPTSLSLSTVITQSTATISWTTDSPATTSLRWGPGSTIVTTVPDDGVYSTQHTVVIGGLTAGSVYSYELVGKDAAGNAYTSVKRSFRTLF